MSSFTGFTLIFLFFASYLCQHIGNYSLEESDDLSVMRLGYRCAIDENCNSVIKNSWCTDGFCRCMPEFKNAKNNTLCESFPRCHNDSECKAIDPARQICDYSSHICVCVSQSYYKENAEHKCPIYETANIFDDIFMEWKHWVLVACFMFCILGSAFLICCIMDHTGTKSFQSPLLVRFLKE